MPRKIREHPYLTEPRPTLLVVGYLDQGLSFVGPFPNLKAAHDYANHAEMAAQQEDPRYAAFTAKWETVDLAAPVVEET